MLVALEEHLRAIEGSKVYGSINPSELYLVLSMIVPKKFKVLEFEKYKKVLN